MKNKKKYHIDRLVLSKSHTIKTHALLLKNNNNNKQTRTKIKATKITIKHLNSNNNDSHSQYWAVQKQGKKDSDQRKKKHNLKELAERDH